MWGGEPGCCRIPHQPVQTFDSALAATHAVGQSGNVVGDPEEVLPAISLDPAFGRHRFKGGEPGTVGLTRAKKTGFSVPKVLPVRRTFGKHRGVVLLAQHRSPLRQSPIFGGVFQCLGGAFKVVGIGFDSKRYKRAFFLRKVTSHTN